MQMQSSLWYDHFIGAAYPLNLKECAQRSSPRKQVKPLLELAADFIVKDSTTTVNAVNVLPQELCITLMKQALEGNRDRAVAVLLSHWPSQTLKVRQLAPDINSSLKLIHDHDLQIETGKQGLRYTTCVAQNFLETLKKKNACRLKFVDMTGFPTAEIITYYLATHCMLAHNESRQHLMIKRYEEAVKMLPDTEATPLERFIADKSMRDDTFGIKFDAFITSEHALNEMCKALKVSSFDESTLRLFVEKIDVTCIGKQKLEILLEQLNAEHVKTMRFKYNSLSSDDFMKLCPQLEQFTNLTTLDLSCNCINVFQNDSACDSMVKLMATLPNLVRLDLSNNRIKSKLRRILSDIQKPLEYLRIVGCSLMLSDLLYLSMSHHTQSLQELDISENNLGSGLRHLTTLLHSVRFNIKILELEESDLNDSHFLQLSSSLKKLTGLMYLNISGNTLTWEGVEAVCQSVSSLEGLQWMNISFTPECYVLYDDEMEERLKSQFSEKIQRLLATRRCANNFNTATSVVLKELEQTIQ